jgi:ribosome-associated heat shock protein Hsp15
MEATPAGSVRIDKWLWAVRLYKTRTLAAEACRAGHVRLEDHPIKASREIRPGDLLHVRTGGLTRQVKVRAVLENRIGAALVPEYLEDLTPPEEIARAREAARGTGPRREPGTGRPTKRDRRLLEAFLTLPTPPPEP